MKVYSEQIPFENSKYIQNTHRFRGFKLAFRDWLKFSLIEGLT
jgi:hypothetical protein